MQPVLRVEAKARFAETGRDNLTTLMSYVADIFSPFSRPCWCKLVCFEGGARLLEGGIPLLEASDEGLSCTGRG